MWPQLLSCQLELLGGEVCCLRVTLFHQFLNPHFHICISNCHILEKNTKEIPETSIWSRESPSPDISSHSHPDIPSWKRIYHHIMLFRWTPDIQISRYPNIQISRYPDIPSWKRVSSYNVISMDGLFTLIIH